MKIKTPFIILSASRTGSSNLCFLFQEMGVKMAHEPKFEDFTLEDMLKDYDGAKINYCLRGSRHWLKPTEDALRLGVKIVYLNRRDKKKQAFSMAILRARKRKYGEGWDPFVNKEEYHNFCKRYPLSPEELWEWQEFLLERERRYDRALAGKPCYRIFYEDFYGKEAESVRWQNFDNLLAYLDIPFTERAKSAAEKYFSPSLSVNPPEVRVLVPTIQELGI